MNYSFYNPDRRTENVGLQFTETEAAATHAALEGIKRTCQEMLRGERPMFLLPSERIVLKGNHRDRR